MKFIPCKACLTNLSRKTNVKILDFPIFYNKIFNFTFYNETGNPRKIRIIKQRNYMSHTYIREITLKIDYDSQ